jgi:anti-sigma regulatory factor (Ser/Thr protein kinase)
MKKYILMPVLAALSLSGSVAQAQDFDNKPVVNVSNSKENLNFTIGARFMMDGAYYHSDFTPVKSGAAITDARIRTSMSYEDWYFYADFDFSKGKFSQKNIFLQYSLEGAKGTHRFKAGYYNNPASMANNTSRGSLHFISRSAAANAFSPSRELGEIHVSFEPLTSAKGLELHCDIAPELESTYICDPLRLRQIINNLLSNAVKFTDEGSITMTARYEERRLVVAIADTGKGMEPADRERIFQEFTRLPGAQGKEGFGLGLSIVRMLVQLLEGTIDVDSVPGKGSTFTLRVPLFPVQVSEDTGEKYQETETGISSALSESMPASSQPSLRVLLIDDDRIQLTLTAAMLQHSGIASVSCMQLDELLDALRSDTFDVLLTDVQMPAINGFDLLKLLRASNLPQAQTIQLLAYFIFKLIVLNLLEVLYILRFKLDERTLLALVHTFASIHRDAFRLVVKPP